jgi:carboxymethylenebutenolidase
VIDPYACFRLDYAVFAKSLARQIGLTQDMPMLNRFDFDRSLIAVILGMLLLLSGCDTGGSGTSSAENQAEVENVEAMAREQARDSTDASGGAQIAPQKAVISERLPYGEVDDRLVYGHFVFPADMVEPLPAVIVIHDWWGLNDNVRAMADRLAAEGYIVLAVDLYGGGTATSAGGARQYMLRVVENPEKAQENIRKAYEFLSEVAGAPQIGSLGWGFGGGWSLNTALLFPEELDATVIYYGQVTADEEVLRTLNVPILGLFGGADTGIPVASVRSFEDALERLRKDYDIHIYPGAERAFANPSGDAYNAEAAEDAWEKTLEFLGRNLTASAEAEEAVE